MQTPNQAPESTPTREEWKTWRKTTCFSQKARGNFKVNFKFGTKKYNHCTK